MLSIKVSLEIIQLLEVDDNYGVVYMDGEFNALELIN